MRNLIFKKAFSVLYRAFSPQLALKSEWNLDAIHNQHDGSSWYFFLSIFFFRKWSVDKIHAIVLTTIVVRSLSESAIAGYSILKTQLQSVNYYGPATVGDNHLKGQKMKALGILW